MQLPAGIHLSARASAAQAALGREHPLARSEERVRWLSGQVATATMLVVASVVGLVLGAEDLRPFAFVSIVVQAVLLIALMIAASTRRERALELIASGHGGLPLAAIQRERARLADPRSARGFARSLDGLRREARLPYRKRPLHRPLYVPAVIRAVDEDLARIIGVLRSCRADIVALARIERLLVGSSSPLYDEDTRRLRDELRRIQFSL